MGERDRNQFRSGTGGLDRGDALTKPLPNDAKHAASSDGHNIWLAQ